MMWNKQDITVFQGSFLSCRDVQIRHLYGAKSVYPDYAHLQDIHSARLLNLSARLIKLPAWLLKLPGTVIKAAGTVIEPVEITAQ
jgi:hypothetical protein